MNGWKTYMAAAIVAVSAGLEALGYGTYATILMMVGNALGLAGIRSAISNTESNVAINLVDLKANLKDIKK